MKRLFCGIMAGLLLCLTGCGAQPEPEQLSLFDMKFESEETRKKKKNLKEALKKLEGKYGDGIVKKGW